MQVPASRTTLTSALEGLTALNATLLQRHPLPPLYQSGVRYRVEQPVRIGGYPVEDWANAHDTFAKGHGDCEDLACWRAAELRLDGIPARAVAIRTGPRMYHAVVLHPDGNIEDPSRRLGMKVPSRRRRQ